MGVEYINLQALMGGTVRKSERGKRKKAFISLSRGQTEWPDMHSISIQREMLKAKRKMFQGLSDWAWTACQTRNNCTQSQREKNTGGGIEKMREKMMIKLKYMRRSWWVSQAILGVHQHLWAVPGRRCWKHESQLKRHLPWKNSC